MAKAKKETFTYLVGVDRIVTSHATFEVTSKKQLSEDEAHKEAKKLAVAEEEPYSDWEENDTTYENLEVEDGDLTEE